MEIEEKNRSYRQKKYLAEYLMEKIIQMFKIKILI